MLILIKRSIHSSYEYTRNEIQIRRINIPEFSFNAPTQQVSRNTAFRFDTKIEH